MIKNACFIWSPYLKGRNGGLDPATRGLYASSGVFFKYIICKDKMVSPLVLVWV